MSAFTGFRFPPEVIMLTVRWYLRYNLSYRDLEELLAERGVEVDHVTLYRWVQRFAPLLIDAAGPCRHSVGRRWFVDETYVKVGGVWRYVYRAIDNEGQIIDVFVSPKRDIAAATKFFTGALLAHGRPVEVVTDKAAALVNVIHKLLPMVHHNTEQYANNRVECDHGRLKARLRQMRGLKTDRGARVVIRGHMFIQNLRRGHYELGTESSSGHLRIAAAFDELTRKVYVHVSLGRTAYFASPTTQQRRVEWHSRYRRSQQGAQNEAPQLRCPVLERSHSQPEIVREWLSLDRHSNQEQLILIRQSLLPSFRKALGAPPRVCWSEPISFRPAHRRAGTPRILPFESRRPLHLC
jgi:transposase, IS6 family